jgi:hypothetical protein
MMAIKVLISSKSILPKGIPLDHDTTIHFHFCNLNDAGRPRRLRKYYREIVFNGMLWQR